MRVEYRVRRQAGMWSVLRGSTAPLRFADQETAMTAASEMARAMAARGEHGVVRVQVDGVADTVLDFPPDRPRRHTGVKFDPDADFARRSLLARHRLDHLSTIQKEALKMDRFTLTAALAAALALGACQQKDEVASAADPGTSNQAVNAAQDAASTAVGAAAATTAQVSTDAFVTNAAMSDMYEIQAGEIAQKKGRSPEVKAFGKTMVADHTAMSNAMKPLVVAAGKTAPPGLDERRKGLLDNLNAAPAADFDAVYLAQQEAAHEEALNLMQGYAANGDDAGLKNAAAQAIPKIQAHLEHVKQLRSSAGAPASGQARP